LFEVLTMYDFSANLQALFLLFFIFLQKDGKKRLHADFSGLVSVPAGR